MALTWVKKLTTEVRDLRFDTFADHTQRIWEPCRACGPQPLAFPRAVSCAKTCCGWPMSFRGAASRSCCRTMRSGAGRFCRWTA